MWKSYNIDDVLKISEMFSFFELDCKKGYHFHGEEHNFWECLYIVEGEVCVSADERIYNLKKNEIIFHKPMEFHKFHTESTEGAKIFVFSYAMDGTLGDYFKDKVFILSPLQNEILFRLLTYARENVKVTDNENGYTDYLSKGEHPEFFLQIALTYIYQLFLSLGENNEIAALSNSFEAKIFKSAVDYMNSYINKNPSVADIAKYCAISDSTLKRIFERFTGIGVHKYFIKLKMKAAKTMLDSGASVNETAERLGFSSQGYFSAAFKREMGFAPSEIKS